VSLASHLAQRCTIQRAVVTADPYGNARQAWHDYLLDVPCRLIEKAETVINSLTAEAAVVTTYTLLVDGSVDIKERDRVSLVALGGNETTVSGPFVVTSVLARRGRALHHKSLILERVA
jgi:hypothetical protein